MTTLPTFAITGVAGCVAPKHLEAIQTIGGKLVAAHDPNDNVELLDDFFPGCGFFKEGRDFESYIASTPIDYLVVCSPTHLHYEQVKMGLKSRPLPFERTSSL